jgi:hypothetical protein
MDSKDNDTERLSADEQALWALLGRSRPAGVSPFFVRRVLRDLDAETSGAAHAAAAGWFAWLRPAWILAGSTGVLAVAVGFISFSTLTGVPLPAAGHRQVVPPVALAVPTVSIPAAAPGVVSALAMAGPEVAAVAKDSTAVADLGDDLSPQDVDVIADLDNLVAREETSVWTDDTSRF